MEPSSEQTEKAREGIGGQRLCIHCGYDLRGLDPEGMCPECGTPVVQSLDRGTFLWANRRWLAQMQIGLWVLLAVTLVSPCLALLTTTGIRLFYTSPFRWILSTDTRGYCSLLAVAAVWLLTSPDPGPTRTSSPALLRGWARWLAMAAYGAILAQVPLAVVLGTASSRTSHTEHVFGILIQAIYPASVVCLLFVLWRYAVRNADVKAAKVLKWAAVLGGINAAATLTISLLLLAVSFRSWLVRTSTPGLVLDWLHWISTTGLVLAVISWALFMWGVGGFAFRLRRDTRALDPGPRVGRTVGHIVAAMVTGGLAGYVVGEVLHVQAKRLPEGSLAEALVGMSWYLCRIGVVLGIAMLPGRMAIVHRVYVRSQRRRFARQG